MTRGTVRKTGTFMFFILMIVAVGRMVLIANGSLGLSELWSKDYSFNGAVVDNVGNTVLGVYQTDTSTGVKVDVYDSRGNSQRDRPWNVNPYTGGSVYFLSKTYDGSVFFYISDNTLYKFYKTDSGWLEKSHLVGNVVFYRLYSTEYDGGYVVVLHGVENSETTDKLTIFSGSDLGNLTSITLRSKVSDMAVSLKSTDFYISVAYDTEDRLEVFNFDGKELNKLEVDEAYPFKLAITEKGYFLVSLERSGRLCLLQRLHSGREAQYVIKAYLYIADPDNIKSIEGLAVQEYDDDGSPKSLFIGVTFTNTTGDYLDVFEYNPEEASLQLYRSVREKGTPIEDLIDMSYYGHFIAVGNSEGFDIHDLTERTDEGIHLNGVNFLDLSADARYLVVTNSTGKDYKYSLHFYSTGVSEDQPVPVPESPYMVLAVILVLTAVALFLRRD